MIDEEKTYREKGYYSTDLKLKSGKPVYAVCEGEDCQREGGRGRWVRKCDYVDLCYACAMKDPCREKCKIPTEKRDCIDDDITYAEKGYRSTDLKPKSGKEVWRVCLGCGDGMWVEFGICTDLCNKCTCKTDEFRRKVGYASEHRSEETHKRMRDNHADFSGENHPHWKGGITPENKKFRASDEYMEWRVLVLERDDYTCQECSQRGGYLNVHHILPYSDWKDPQFSLNIKNGITLCKDCHKKTFRREYEFFNKYFDIANGVGKYKK